MTRSADTLGDVVLLTAALGAALLVSPVFGHAVSGVAPIGAALLVAGLTVLYGRAIGRALQLPHSSYRNIFELVTGFGGVSLVHLSATAVLNLTTLRTLPIDIVVGVIVLAVTVRRERPDANRSAAQDRRAIWIDACVLVGCAALVAFWTRETISSIPDARATGFFRTWQDFFLHASEVTYLRDYPAYGRQTLYLAGVPQPLYHRASYAMAALFSAIGGVPSLETATTFWMPTGLWLCVLATYAFGCALGGRLAGLASVAAVFLFPDPSTYGLKNQFLGFAWLMQVSGGSGYAIALTLLALTVLAIADTIPDRRRLLIASGLVGAAALFRIHISAVAGGMLLLLAGFAWRPWLTRRRIAMTVAALYAAVGLVMLMETMTLAPHFVTGHAHPMLFLQLVHGMADAPTTYAAWTDGRSDAVRFVIGYALLLVSACGVMIPALIVVGWGGLLGDATRRVLWFLLALIVAHVAVILLVPTPVYGDLSDYGHRPFVLIYAVMAALVGAAIGRLLAQASRRIHGSERPGFAWLAAMMVAGCAVPLAMGRDLQQRWGSESNFALTPITADEFEAGRFVRQHSTPGEHVLIADNDPIAVFVGLTERSAFLSRSELYRRIGGSTHALATERAAAHAALLPLSSFEQLQSFGRDHDVRWYVANTPASQLWPIAVRRHCVFCGRSVQVYDLR